MRRWSSVEKSSSRRIGTATAITDESARMAPRIACSASRLRGRARSVVMSSIIGWTAGDSSVVGRALSTLHRPRSPVRIRLDRRKKFLPQSRRFPQIDWQSRRWTNGVRAGELSAFSFQLSARILKEQTHAKDFALRPLPDLIYVANEYDLTVES